LIKKEIVIHGGSTFTTVGKSRTGVKRERRRKQSNGSVRGFKE